MTDNTDAMPAALTPGIEDKVRKLAFELNPDSPDELPLS